MSRLGLVLALFSLLFVSSHAAEELSTPKVMPALNLTSAPFAAGPGYKKAGWNQITRAAQWEPRAGGVVESFKGRVWTGRGYTEGDWLLLYGSGIWTCFGCSAKEEVWASANKGRTWVQVEMSAPFNPLVSAQTVQTSTGTQFRIQGTPETDHACNGEVYSDVWMSTDGGYKWTQPAGDGLNSPTSRFLGTAVIDSSNTIYVMHGQVCDGALGYDVPLNDVWASSDMGRRWRQVRQAARGTPPARSVHGSVVGKYYETSGSSGVDAMYIMFGWRGADQTGNLYRNDVWVTTNGATSWVQLTDKASWTARGDSQLEVTANGVLVIAGGVSNIEGTERRQLNDVWASLDGGYTWGVCSDNARWDDRVFAMTAIDSEGYLYVMGGQATDPNGETYWANDVWQSAESYNDVNAVADMCGLIIPPCGVGLRCIDTKDNNFVQGVWGVSCDACSWNPTTASAAPAASMVMTYLFVAFLLVSLALAAALGFLLYRMRASGVSSPIPLPASAQRWWSDKQGSDGLSEGLNKGNTASEADTMYNPLTIRDQM